MAFENHYLRVIIADCRFAEDSHLREVSVDLVWVAFTVIECFVDPACITNTHILQQTSGQLSYFNMSPYMRTVLSPPLAQRW